MKIGIIGARGFVGTALQRHCAQSIEISEVRVFGHTEFDLVNPGTWNGKLAGLDCVVNAAVQIEGNSYDIYSTNCLYLRELAHHLNECGIEKLVNLSTGAVYGPLKRPSNPSLPCRPEGDYAVSKYLGERILSDSYLGELCHLRLYYPYGAKQKLPRIIPRLIENVASKQPIACDSRGGPILSMTHVDDIAAAILTDFILSSVNRSVFNISSPHRISIQEIAQEIAGFVGVEPELKRSDDEVSDVISEPYESRNWRPFSLHDYFDRSPSLQ